MARLGIYVAQQAITVTGNNISNINTKGYSRQELDQTNLTFGGSDKYQSRFDTRVSAGVIANGVAQLRDKYLDIHYRNEQTSVGALDAKMGGLNRLASILDEVGMGEDEAGVLEARFNELIEHMELMTTQGAGKDDIDTLVRSSANALCKTFNDYAQRLETEAKNEANKFDQNVETVNTILERIRDLNSDIRKTQIYGGNALTQQDERNVLIDQLSEYVGINVTYDMEVLGDGLEVERLKITTNSNPEHDLIYGIYGSQFSVRQIDTVDEEGNPITVDSPNYELSISQLKTSRDLVFPGSTDYEFSDTELSGSLQAQREILTEAGEYATAHLLSPTDKHYDMDAETKRGFPYYQKALDTLASTFAKLMNEANSGGNPASDDASLRGGVLFSIGNNGDIATGITAKNITVSQSWSEGKIRVLRSTKENPASRDQENLQHFVTLLTSEQRFSISDGADPYFVGTFQEMMTNGISATLADDMMVTNTLLGNHMMSSDELYVGRDSVMGVDLNDEAMNMMQFQKAYSAACRLMTTFDSMVDKLVNGTAV
jgi:flagellar hook-associated protein 1 FlgK